VNARRLNLKKIMSLNILLTHSRLFKVIRNDTLEQDVCKSLLVGLSIETMSVPRTVSEIFNMKYKKTVSIENDTIRKLFVRFPIRVP